MDYRFTPEQEAFRAEVVDFIKKELSPRLAAGEDPYADANWDDAMAFRKKMGRRKWIGIGWPKAYGGLGAGHMMQMIFHEQMVYHNGPLDPQAFQVGPAIITSGNDYLKKTFLAATASQDIVWAQGFSEPGAGSDLANLQTRAVEDGDDYVINGDKIWTTYAHRANFIHILTRTDPDAPKHKGISYFVLDMKSPGITIRPLVDMVGQHHFNQVFFDNVRVPKRNMIGEKNRGWYVAMTTLENERSGIRDVSRAARYYDDVLNALKQMQGVAGVRRDKAMLHKLADLSVQLAVSRQLSYHVAWMQERGLPINREAPMAKLFGSELSQRVTYVGMTMLGQYGMLLRGGKHAVVHGAVPDRYMGSIPNTIAAGSSEVQRNIIGTRGLGLPKGF